MNTDLKNPETLCLVLVLLLSVFISVHGFASLTTGLWLLPSAWAQEESEIVVNLAAGRVTVLVAREGMAIGAVEQKMEAESRGPVVVQLSERRLGILLGAVEWLQPASGAEPVRMDRQLLKLMGEIAGPKRLDAEHADDIEKLGLAMLEALRPMTSRLHRKVELAEGEPLLELLLVGYVENYGPEVWSLRYYVVQEPVRGSYWRTRILRPRYTQLYPPEKGQPRTLMEVSFPPAAKSESLLERLENDASLAAMRSGDAPVARAGELIRKGESHKAKLDDALTWLRALLNATSPAEAAQAVGVIAELKGFDWIVAPPERTEKVEESKPREPGAPTLRKKP